MNQPDRQLYLRNAYRVILTRAPQGMVIYVPTGNDTNQTHLSSFFDGILSYLIKCGVLAVDKV
ncbi:hypothetical protein HY29_16590 [Hyphomonas beringensis]|uniref:Schlafen group 3-like DNA/RNA helicase domain-containing protein n=1 Tax=Hyphomonas beringensis TaxID=1280946 RepID=A0A062U5T1_9PROT|nr:hypothetical protein HY29_16590 [Hyphomonas beringensis]